MAETTDAHGAFDEFDLPVPSHGPLHVATWGSRGEPERAVLLVHGITGNCRTMAYLGPVLAAAGYHAVAPDLRGRGRSFKPPHGYGIPFHADDLVSLLDALELPAAHLVGHSLGAQIGLYLAALHPERLRRLVAIDAGGVVPPDAAQALAPSFGRIGRDFASLDDYLATVRQAMTPIIGGPNEFAFWETVYRYEAAPQPDGGVRSSLPLHALHEESATNRLLRVRELPGLVKAPTLLVRAGRGLLGPKEGEILTRAEAERVSGTIPECELVEIAGANHYTIVTAPELAERVVGFLAAG